MSNEDFGIRHFPENPSKWYRADGRALGWEEYILLDAHMPQTFAEWESDHGLRRLSLIPENKKVRVSGANLPPTERISLTRVCPHWAQSSVVKPDYLLLLKVPGRKGPFRDLLTFETDGFNFWLDVPRNELGAPGEEMIIMFLQTIEGQDARGTTRDYFENFVRCKKAISFGYLATWKLV
jgi:hypothetical protein